MRGDLIHAVRALRRSPLMSAVVVVSLGLGIGVNTIVFSWIQALVLRPLPGVPDAARFYLIEPHTDAMVRPGVSWLEYQDLRAARSFEDLIAFRMVPLSVGEPPRVERGAALLVSGNYFPVLGLQPALGRWIRPDDADAPGGEPVVVLSFDYWQSRFAGADVVGRTLLVNDTRLTIVGVAPANFQGTILGLQFDMWVPASIAPVLLAGSRELDDRRMRGYYVMGRLGRDKTLAGAQSEVDALMRRLAADYPEASEGIRSEVLPFWRASRGPQGLLLQGLTVLQGVMLVLLLAVCGNAANLLLARATTRVREVGVRLAVGAGQWHILRLVMAENLVLGVAGAAIGAAMAWWGTNALRAMPLLTTQFPVRFQTDLTSGTLAFAFVLGVLAALAFGLVPAAQLARTLPQAALRAGAASAGRSSLRLTLMGVEVALAVIVLIAAALFLRGFQQTYAASPGFRPQGVLLATYDLAGRDIDRQAARQFADRVLTELRSVPDVEAAALAVSVPLDIHGLPVRDFTLEGRASADGRPERTLTNTVSAGYFETMGIRILAGRDFAALGDAAAPPQAIVNDAFVRRYVGEGEVLGRIVTIAGLQLEIVGVVETTLSNSFTEPPTPVVYISFRDRPAPFAEMHVRTSLADETILGPAVRRTVQALDPSLPIFNVRTLTQHVEMNLALRRIPARMFVVLGPVMLVLAAIGIYGVVAYHVAHRTAEIGVRMALGADATSVVRQVMTENLRVVVAGGVAGWSVVAYTYTHLVRGEFDLLAFVGVPALLWCVAAAACWIPARRASRISPVVALRAE